MEKPKVNAKPQRGDRLWVPNRFSHIFRTRDTDVFLDIIRLPVCHQLLSLIHSNAQVSLSQLTRPGVVSRHEPKQEQRDLTGCLFDGQQRWLDHQRSSPTSPNGVLSEWAFDFGPPFQHALTLQTVLPSDMHKSWA
ncbi:MAG: hypothetical protein AAF623_17220 [Planctomycetota bacterium]